VAKQTIIKMGHLIKHNSIAEDLNRLSLEDKHTEQERAVFNVYQSILADQKEDSDLRIKNAEKVGVENLNKLTEEYEKKFKSAIIDFEIRFKEENKLHEIERFIQRASDTLVVTPCHLDCNRPNCPCSNPTQRYEDRDESLKQDGTVRSTSTLSTSSE
jgi:uncharacterized protein YchJ